MFGKEPDYKEMKSFGTLYFPLIPKIVRDKLDLKSTRSIFLGGAKDHKGYKCLGCDKKGFFISRNVRFHEESFPGFSTSSTQDEVFSSVSFPLTIEITTSAPVVSSSILEKMEGKAVQPSSIIRANEYSENSSHQTTIRTSDHVPSDDSNQNKEDPVINPDQPHTQLS